MGYELKESDVYDFAAVVNADTVLKGDELYFKYCPYCHGGNHHDKETFSVNLKNGAFKCFRSSCSRQGHFAELARDFSFPLDFGDSAEKQYRTLTQKNRFRQIRLLNISSQEESVKKRQSDIGSRQKRPIREYWFSRFMTRMMCLYRLNIGTRSTEKESTRTKNGLKGTQNRFCSEWLNAKISHG